MIDKKRICSEAVKAGTVPWEAAREERVNLAQQLPSEIRSTKLWLARRDDGHGFPGASSRVGLASECKD